ncbi:carbohydrate ABC transporter permease [Pseudohoeflea coraliihabitans]|uniref:Maltose/maltodextrin transport system permease protein MalG n=1 Tax=Pseudohoeflea coraliihabitans TaxID=2860393 RepID=A0ABS6WML4_9HYPH|nr:carbohydrate ABC transporter permease [Pseudohoeflea sp. DP4N28-3]MBW3097204.1 carbohydrate ABC transporter permease [Pseudohoeflea sp. DP4N28-3]
MKPYILRQKLRHGILFLTLSGITVLMLLPFIWVIITSLKPESQVYVFPPEWVPSPVTLENYQAVWASNMPLYLFNSTIVAVGSIILTLIVSIHAAYAVSRFKFRGMNVFMFLLIASHMIPGVANLVPTYLLASKMNLLDTYIVLILVYSMWQTPLVVWLIQGFLQNVPQSLDKAAMVDGYSRLGAMYRVVVPLSKPGLAAAAIVVFVYAWNEFVIALTLTSSDEMRLAQVGLKYYISQFGIQWGELTAAVVLSTIPVLLLFILLQKWFIYGLTSGAMKG